MFGKWLTRKSALTVDEYGRTPLHYAAVDGNLKQVQRLIRQGMNVNSQDKKGWSPLHCAAQAISAEVASALLEAGADLTLRDCYGNTPLWRAVSASKGDGSVIRLLRSAGADPHAANDSGITPVESARTVANFDLAQYFDDLS